MPDPTQTDNQTPGKQTQAKAQDEHAARVDRSVEGLVVIEFLQGQPPYNAGETAGFPPEIADRYCNARVKGQPVARRAKGPKTLPAGTEE